MIDKKFYNPDYSSVHEIQAFVKNHLVPKNAGKTDVADIDLIVEEIVVNIIRHGLKNRPDAMIWIEIDPREKTVLTVSDNGIPFNPLNIPAPDIHADLDTRQPGGLGFHLVRKKCRECRYSRKEGLNRLRITLW